MDLLKVRIKEFNEVTVAKIDEEFADWFWVERTVTTTI